MSETVLPLTPTQRLREQLRHPLAASSCLAGGADLIDRALAAFYRDDEPPEDRDQGVYAERLRVKMIRAVETVLADIESAEQAEQSEDTIQGRCSWREGLDEVCPTCRAHPYNGELVQQQPPSTCVEQQSESPMPCANPNCTRGYHEPESCDPESVRPEDSPPWADLGRVHISTEAERQYREAGEPVGPGIWHEGFKRGFTYALSLRDSAKQAQDDTAESFEAFLRREKHMDTAEVLCAINAWWTLTPEQRYEIRKKRDDA